MRRHIAHITLVVNDYDEALDFYINKLNFTLVEDTVINENKRWVLVAPDREAGSCLLLAKAANDEQRSCVGNQSGGRVFLFLHTDDFENDYRNLLDNRITIIREPRTERYGKVAVFADLYGNLWDLIQPEKE